MSIHPTLLADTLTVCETPQAYVRLMNDSRWPWIILIPKMASIEELHDLPHQDRDLFLADVNQVSRVIKTITHCKSVNIAMLGNVVTQLHCHVVARNEEDPNWPKPIWGYEQAIPYNGNEPTQLIEALRKTFY